MLKVLNAYAGVGGNRRLWTNVKVTAIENCKEIAEAYKDLYPEDEVIVADAHQYILENYDKFDLIWSSRPCQSHSRARYWGSFGENKTKIYPDMGLYEEIIFLKHYCKTKWVVENVKPYYEPLIKPTQVCGRHLFWANFDIKKLDLPTRFTPNQSFGSLQKAYDIDLSKYKFPFGQDNRVIIRNMVEAELGKHVFECAFRDIQVKLMEGLQEEKIAHDGIPPNSKELGILPTIL